MKLKTRKSFYRALRKIADRYNWVITDSGIRGFGKGNDSYVCPIIAVAMHKRGFKYKESLGVSVALEVGQVMGLSAADSHDIINAADNNIGYDNILKAIKRAVKV